MWQYNWWMTIYKWVWYLQIKVTFLVVPECIWVEERFATRGTHQPHPQKHSVHMCADGGTWGWWSLHATFNLASILCLHAPQLNAKGLHVDGESFLWSWEAAGEAASNACSTIFAAGSEASGVTHVGSWGGWQETVVNGMWQAFLQGGAEDMEGVL